MIADRAQRQADHWRKCRASMMRVAREEKALGCAPAVRLLVEVARQDHRRVLDALRRGAR